jgi:L-fuconolactonase
MLPVIDTHVHFWKYDPVRDAWIGNNMKELQQDYLPPTLQGTLSRNGVNGCVAVQADQSEVETLFLKELSVTYPIVKGVVGWVDLKADNVAERLQYFKQFDIVKGFRHVVQSEPDGFLANEQFRRGVAQLAAHNYTYDVLVYHHQLPQAIDFVQAFPEQPFVVDHAAKPDIAKKELKEWEKNIRLLAQHPAMYCKLSGLFTEARWKEWSAAEFYPYLDVLFDAFGTDRLMFGSDWPVMLLSGIYVQWKSLLEKYMEPFSEQDKAKVFGLNAIKFYNLQGFVIETEA